MKADFSGIEGFLRFADSYGLDWLATVDPDYPRDESFLELLRKVFKLPEELGIYEPPPKRGYRLYLSQVEKYFQHVKKTLLAHQNTMEMIDESVLSESARGYLKKWEGSAETVHPLKKLLSAHEQIINESLSDVYLRMNPQPDGTIEIEKRYRTFLARCYSEIVDLLAEGITLKECQHCKLLFVPLRPNERYCRRLVAGSLLTLTCHDVGPQRRYEGDLETLKWRREYQRLFGRRKYAARTKGKGSKKYRQADRELQEWKKNKPTKY